MADTMEKLLKRTVGEDKKLKKLISKHQPIIDKARAVLLKAGLSFQQVVDYESELRATIPLSKKLLPNNTLPNDFIENDTLRTRSDLSPILKTYCHVFHHEGTDEAKVWWNSLTTKQQNECRRQYGDWFDKH